MSDIFGGRGGNRLPCGGQTPRATWHPDAAVAGREGPAAEARRWWQLAGGFRRFRNAIEDGGAAPRWAILVGSLRQYGARRLRLGAALLGPIPVNEGLVHAVIGLPDLTAKAGPWAEEFERVSDALHDIGTGSSRGRRSWLMGIFERIGGLAARWWWSAMYVRPC